MVIKKKYWKLSSVHGSSVRNVLDLPLDWQDIRGDTPWYARSQTLQFLSRFSLK